MRGSWVQYIGLGHGPVYNECAGYEQRCFTFIDKTDFCKLWDTKLLLQCTFIELILASKCHEILSSETKINP